MKIIMFFLGVLVFPILYFGLSIFNELFSLPIELCFIFALIIDICISVSTYRENKWRWESEENE